MMDLISWPVVLSIAVPAAVLLVVALFYHAGRRVGAVEVLNLIKHKLSTIDGPGGAVPTLHALCKEIRETYDLD